MELRVLQYFLAVTREQSISGAAEYLHLSQPTLSRQLKDMEDELGKQLMIRGNRKITLTEEGMILRKRAEEILNLVQKTEQEITVSNAIFAGEIYIGAGETDAVRLIAKAAKQLQEKYPDMNYRISSGDSIDVFEDLDKGLIDFGLVFGSVDSAKYEYINFPIKDEYGLLVRKDDPLAKKKAISPSDIWDKPLMFNRNTRDGDLLTNWLGKSISEIHIAATYNLLYNASLMVDEGLGYAFALDKIIHTGSTNLTFIPFSPKLEAKMSLIWKKYQIFPKHTQKFLEKFQETVNNF